jgi:AcrR family transcriptional regulator
MAEAEPAPVNRFELRRRRNRAALIAAATELFQTRGVQTTSLEEICERADVAVRTFFNHFETREHLHQAIARERALQVAEVLDALSRDPRPLATRMAGLFSAIGAYVSERPAYRDFVAEMLRLRSPGANETVRSGSLGQAAHRFVADAAARGELTPAHSPEALADLMIGAITTALSNWSASSDYDLVRGLEEASNALSDLFAPADEASPSGGRSSG